MNSNHCDIAKKYCTPLPVELPRFARKQVTGYELF
jgi:hypothetical protein